LGEIENKNKLYFCRVVKNVKNMATIILDKPNEKIIDWINPRSDEITLEEYRREMQAAEKSDFISFEEHKKNMNQWMATKL